MVKVHREPGRPGGETDPTGPLERGLYAARMDEEGPGTGASGWSRRAAGTRLFLVSYAPLWAIFAFLSRGLPSLLFFVTLTVWGMVDGYRIVHGGRRRSSRRMSFDTVSDRSGAVAGYLATYLLPFIAGPPSGWRQAAAYVVYFVAAWAVFVPSDLALVNPTLYLLGWRVVEVTRNGERAFVVCDAPMEAGADYRVSSLMGGVGYVLRPDPVKPSDPSQ